MSGTTGAIMFGMIGVGAGTTTVLKGSKSLIKLLDKSGDLYSNVKNINRVETVFDSALQNTRLGRMVMSPVRSGIQFEITGNVIGSMEEEMNFASGFIGAAAGNAMQNIFSKVPVGKLSEHIVRFFGKSAPDAAKIISNFGSTIKPMKNLHYRGLGEMFEESAQELTQIYRDELRSRDFWTEVSSIYGEPSNIAQLLISSYVMGAGMGIGSTDYQNNLIEQATSEDIDFANKVMAGLTYDFAEANASAEEAANAIVKNEENLTKDDTKDEQRVSSEEQVGEESIEAEPEQRTGEKEIGDGGMVQEEQAEGEVTEETPKEIESVTAESVEDAQRLWDEGYRAEGVDNKGQLEGMFATGRPGLNMTREAQVEGQVEGKIEEDVKEAKIISLADRIRSGKIDSDIAAAVPVPGFTQAWNTALEGVALTVEGVETAIKKLRAQDWYRNKISDDQRAIIETELEKISVSNNLKGKWNNAISRKANKKGFAEKARDEVKRSSWYKNTLTDEQRAEVDKTLDKKVENINNRISESESEGLVGKDLSDKIASIKGQNTYRTKRLPSQKKEAIRKATEELKTAKAKFNKAYREGKKAGEEIGEKTQKEREQVKKNLQEALINYVRESLPKGTRSSNTFVTATAKSVTNIDSIEKFNAAKERIDKKIESINDKARVSLADKVFKTLNDTKTYLKGKSGKKKGRISIEAQNKLKTMAAEYSQDKLKSMTADELDILNEEIQEGIDQGRSEVRAGLIWMR
jgi:hypothetical protein